MTPAKIAPPPPPRRRWPGKAPRPITDANRIIGATPIYDLDEVKRLVKEYGVVVINDNAEEDRKGAGRNPLPPPTWELDEIKGVLLALEPDCYENSQWCGTSVGWALDCDSYVIYYGRARRARWQHGIKLYVKFGFNPNVSFKGAVICSIHPANH